MKTYWRAPRLSRLFLVSATLVPFIAGAQAVKTVAPRHLRLRSPMSRSFARASRHWCESKAAVRCAITSHARAILCVW